MSNLIEDHRLNIPTMGGLASLRRFAAFLSRRVNRRKSDQKAAPNFTLAQDANSSQLAFPTFPPPTPRVILTSRNEYIQQLQARKWRAPRGAAEDTPLFTLYRIYEFLLVDHVVGYRNQIEYFWRQRSWAIKEIPDPNDSDVERYVFLACVAEILVTAFNYNIEHGIARDAPAIMTLEEAEAIRNRPEEKKMYESAPSWTQTVPKLPEFLDCRIFNDVDKIPFSRCDDQEDGENVEFRSERLDPVFKAKNILLLGPHILFT